MKNKLIFLVVLLVCIPISIGIQTERVEGQQETNTSGTFKAGERPMPDFPEEGPVGVIETLDQDETTASLNHLYLTHAPRISFGQLRIDPKNKEYPALLEKRTQQNKTYYLPHTVGVADLSGKDTGAWKVTVKQLAPFYQAEKATYLTDTRLRIYGNTVTNNRLSSVELKNKITGLKQENGQSFAMIPVENPSVSSVKESEGELEVLKSNSSSHSSKTYSNSVFESQYKKENYTSSVGESKQTYDGIKLFIPTSDNRLLGAYEADLVWTLTAEP
ncbi:WxL domain-containing protein [Vagococcus sp.]|uniref:WxL domain-containing protein n=1 Tax=Vagococcus sp. TaxID=1933889 RepID=UPI003F954CF0